MKKNGPDSHPCGCCGSGRPTSRALVILKPEERPLLDKQREKQRPTEGPLEPPHAEDGS